MVRSIVVDLFDRRPDLKVNKLTVESNKTGILSDLAGLLSYNSMTRKLVNLSASVNKMNNLLLSTNYGWRVEQPKFYVASGLGSLRPNKTLYTIPSFTTNLSHWPHEILVISLSNRNWSTEGNSSFCLRRLTNLPISGSLSCNSATRLSLTISPFCLTQL